MNKSKIDDYAPVFIIAELSANHGGDIEIAKKLLERLKELGQMQ